jgi:hypothetical protein
MVSDKSELDSETCSVFNSGNWYQSFFIFELCPRKNNYFIHIKYSLTPVRFYVIDEK